MPKRSAQMLTLFAEAASLMLVSNDRSGPSGLQASAVLQSGNEGRPA
ncbi:MAG: hypothetical protein M3N28_07005 [Actinomycetota bacterium]|nr:hypothetical protein [Actinomycetota bacterium]